LIEDQNSKSADNYQQLLQTLDFADNELGLDLWLIAEQLMLFRLTRAGEQKRYELAVLVHAIHEIKSQSEGEAAVPREIISLDDSSSEGFKGRADAKLTEVFSSVIDAAEQMNSEELYRLIALLRKVAVTKIEEIDTAPLDRAQEFLSRGPVEEQPWNPLDE
jgi:hypothetical protein